MASLKKIRAVAEELSDRLGLPGDLIFGSAKITVIASKRILVENHRGILEYGNERIVIRLDRAKLCLSGSGFEISAMNKNQILICGKLQCADWE